MSKYKATFTVTSSYFSTNYHLTYIVGTPSASKSDASIVKPTTKTMVAGTELEF